MDTASVPRTQDEPAGSKPYSVTLDIDSPSSLCGRPYGGIDLRWVRSVGAGGIFSVFLLAASGIAFPSTSLFLHPYASSATQRPSPAGPPRFACLVSGSAGDAGRLRRCLLALYHPRNHYILHLDAEAPDSERTELAAFVATHPVLAAVGNVRVLEKANHHGGITMVTTTLNAAATFLRSPRADWDWFINLSASDYPLVTQDDLMDVFSRLPRDLNFIDHTSDMGWKAAVNHNMHYISWGDSPGHHPELINSSHWDGMLSSDAPFACNFDQDDPVLDRIDAELLSRQPGMLAPGSWSIGDIGGDGSCWIVRDTAPLRPGPGAARLQRLVTSLLSEQNFRPNQCKIVDDNA